MVNVLIAASMLAIIVEALIENFGQAIPSAYKVWLSAATGVALCVLFGANAIGVLIGQLGLTSPLPEPYLGIVGSVLTGLLIGRGSNYFNDLISRLKVTPAPSQPVDVVLDRQKITEPLEMVEL